ncbi:MAG TPA: GrpB family protein [Thermoanaerobaculia bacterium]|nr:GrpB family protein [Thermoanaerobaculia bacterium]
MVPITVVPYDPRWPKQYAEERIRLLHALGAIARRIEHNGSTAVPGLAAKPIIDIQISVDTLLPIDTYRIPLQRLGYAHVPHADDAFCPFFHRPAAWPHTHHVHVVAFGGEEEARTLVFRDYLRVHPGLAREYGVLKAELAQQHSASDAVSREAYAKAKSEFIDRIIRLARAGGYPHFAG